MEYKVAPAPKAFWTTPDRRAFAGEGLDPGGFVTGETDHPVKHNGTRHLLTSKIGGSEIIPTCRPDLLENLSYPMVSPRESFHEPGRSPSLGIRPASSLSEPRKLRGFLQTNGAEETLFGGLTMVKKRRTAVAYVRKPRNVGGSATLVRSLMSWIAGEQARSMSRSITRGMVDKAMRGCWLGGQPPLGFDLEYSSPQGMPYMRVCFLGNGVRRIYSPKGRLVRGLARGQQIVKASHDRVKLVPSRSHRRHVVKRIFDMYAAGLSAREIAHRLNGNRVPNPRNRTWAGSTVLRILKNEVYCGTRVWNRHAKGQFRQISHEVPAGRQRPEEDWIVVPNAHEPLVDRDTFDAVQLKLGSKKNGRPRGIGSGMSKPLPAGRPSKPGSGRNHKSA